MNELRRWNLIMIVGCSLIAVFCLAALALPAEQSFELRCLHYQHDYRQPAYCDPERQRAEEQTAIIILQQQQQQQQITPRPNLRDFHRRYPQRGGQK